jgi:hypothetical protein
MLSRRAVQHTLQGAGSGCRKQIEPFQMHDERGLHVYGVGSAARVAAFQQRLQEAHGSESLLAAAGAGI